MIGSDVAAFLGYLQQALLALKQKVELDESTVQTVAATIFFLDLKLPFPFGTAFE